VIQTCISLKFRKSLPWLDVSGSTNELSCVLSANIPYCLVYKIYVRSAWRDH